jgi:hypothetical protein
MEKVDYGMKLRNKGRGREFEGISVELNKR